MSPTAARRLRFFRMDHKDSRWLIWLHEPTAAATPPSHGQRRRFGAEHAIPADRFAAAEWQDVTRAEVMGMCPSSRSILVLTQLST